MVSERVRAVLDLKTDVKDDANWPASLGFCEEQSTGQWHRALPLDGSLFVLSIWPSGRRYPE